MTLLLAFAFAADRDVLFLGNSYTAANGLAGVVEGAAAARPVWPEPTAVALTRGGWSFDEHLAALDQPGPWQEAAAQRWDVVVLQDQSQIPGFPDDDSARLGSVAALEGLVAAFDGSQLALLLTWGRRTETARTRTATQTFRRCRTG